MGRLILYVQKITRVLVTAEIILGPVKMVTVEFVEGSIPGPLVVKIVIP